MSKFTLIKHKSSLMSVTPRAHSKIQHEPILSVQENFEQMYPALEEFVCLPPAINFFNYKKLARISEDIRKINQQIIDYIPNEKPAPSFEAIVHEDSQEEEPKTEALEHVPPETLEVVPPFYQPTEHNDILQPFFSEIFDQAKEFCREKTQLSWNYYDAIQRENERANSSVDHRPITDALRFISKKIGHPMDSDGPKFYKHNYRCEKTKKKNVRLLSIMNKSQECISELLHNQQMQRLLSIGEVSKINVSHIKIPRLLPVEPMN